MNNLVNPNPQTEETNQAADTAETDEHAAQKKPLTIVGIGASAGGLKALQTFFTAVPGDSGMAFVVITHMDPKQESLLPEILERHTNMPVHQVRSLVPITADNVYVISPNLRLIVTDTHLNAQPFDEPRGRRTPVDFFFRSLGSVHQSAVAVILSGGGSDGAVGVKTIQEAGGLLLVQDPDEAEHDSMPRAAIGAGLADIILPVRQMVAKLVEFNRNGVGLSSDPSKLSEHELETIYRILVQVQMQTGHDFSQYKRTTLIRRIQRRLQLHGIQTLETYLAFLRGNDGEAAALFNDLLIGVTNFFRDAESWAALADQVIPHLFDEKQPDEKVRVWSIGCATGEEAYSLAILLLEHMSSLPQPRSQLPTLQIFASDLDEAALRKARDGFYPEAIEADVTPERLKRFFTKEGHYYQIKEEVREIVLFSNHSVLRDPPFSYLDLISCRNLLIYLERNLQEKVFQIFHYALNPEKYLFLGSAESADLAHKLFYTLDKHHRLYRARPRPDSPSRLPTLPLTVRQPGAQQGRAGRAGGAYPSQEREKSTTQQHYEFLETNALPSVMVNDQYRVLHFSETVGRYMQHPGGTPTYDLLELARPELAHELRTILFQAFAQNTSVLSHPVFVQFNGAPRRVVIAVQPHAPPDAPENGPEEQLALVFFMEHKTEEQDAPDERRPAPYERENLLLEQLGAENRRLRERLQSTHEEYVSSNEELKAANEELQSINEEYRSATEELETSKEELQSVNEELQTVNTELKNKLDEVRHARNDLENLMETTDIVTLFLDRNLHIQRYTPNTVALFNVMPGDRGRPIDHLTNRLEYETIAADARQVLEELTRIEREVKDEEGNWFQARLRPYRTRSDRIEGVVITFIDITELKQSEQALRRSERRIRKLLQIDTVGVVFFNRTGDIVDANAAFLNKTGYTEQEVADGKLNHYNLTPPQWLPRSRRHIDQAKETGLIHPYEKEYYHKDGSRSWFLAAGAHLDDSNFVEFTIDITEQKEVEETLHQERDYSKKIIHTIRESLLVLKPDLTVEFANEPFYQMFQVDEAKTIGAVIYRLGNGQWDIPELRRLLEDILPERDVFNSYRVEHDFEKIGRRIMILNARRLDHIERILLAIEDVTERESYAAALLSRQKELADLNTNLEERVGQRTEQVRQLTAQLTLAEHEERERISQILHDDLQQQLYSLQIQIAFLRDRTNDEKSLEEMDGMAQAVKTAIKTARRLSVELSPPILEGEGLTEAIAWLAQQMEQRYGLQVEIEADGSFTVDALDRRILLFQSVRELLFNVVKHAGDNRAMVRLQTVDDPEIDGERKVYRIDVIDKGAGFDLKTVLGEKATTRGRGLLHIQERLCLLGGRLEAHSIPGDGTQMSIIVASTQEA